MSKQREIPWGGSGGSYKKCSDSHPALPIGEYKIYGGACGNPIHLDCDIYVALQAGSKVGLPQPWEPGFGQIIQVEYSITDMKAPSNPDTFKKLIDWLCNQLQSGKKIHVGCIGGHGRTGTVLAAIVAQMLKDEPDAIGYVRKNYCHKAVESSTQVQFLAKYYGVKVVSGAKEGTGGSVSPGVWGSAPASSSSGTYQGPKSTASGFSVGKVTRFANSLRTLDPVPSRRNIFAQA